MTQSGDENLNGKHAFELQSEHLFHRIMSPRDEKYFPISSRWSKIFSAADSTSKLFSPHKYSFNYFTSLKSGEQ